MKGNSHKVQMSVLSKLVSVFTILLFFSSITHAQVTIGLGEEPISGALLQLKEKGKKDLQNNNDPNSNKGLAFPRVALVQKDRLYPMFGDSEATETNYYSGNRSVINSEHTGLVVYNTYISPTGQNAPADPNLIFQEGLYVWTGDKWAVVSGQAINGLHEQNGYIQLGGDLTLDETTIAVDNRKLIFDLENIPENTRESGFMIKGLKQQANSRAVVADVITGRLGLSEVIPARLAFIQSGTETLNTDAINEDDGYWVIPWDERDVNDGGDVVTNNGVLKYVSSSDGGYWTMEMDAMVEISGMVGYRGGTGANGSVIVINTTIQIRRKKGPDANKWKDYSSVRGVYAGTVNAYRNTLNIPPAMADLDAGDDIRMLLARAPDTETSNPNDFLGSNHLTGGSTNPATNGVVKPYGTEFSKMLKVVVQ